MSKDKISDYSQTANSNTDIGGINVDEGCAPSGINDAIRTLMKQLKDWQSGSQDVYIHPAGSASVPSITATGDTNTGIFFPAADTVGITTGGTERARIDSSGNLGLGVTPSAWGGAYKVNQILNAAFVGVGNRAYMSANYYDNGTNDKYIASDYATRYLQINGTHRWENAASGTAGGTVTFTQAMTLNASGYLGVGTTSPSFPLDIQSTGVGSSIAGRIYRSDGTIALLRIGNSTSGSSSSAPAFGSDTTAAVVYTSNSERMRIDSSGNVLVTSSGGLGYGTGSGGTVTQATSRTTGVTINKTNGAITLVSAAGSTTIASFTVTNSTVAATDTIHICQKSGTDLYRIYVTNVAAGSFKVSFATLSGTTTEQPVFNFAVIKSVTS